MKIKMIVIASAAFVLAGCNSTCTEEDLQAKVMGLSEKVQKMATSGDMSKLMELSQKSMKISQAAQSGDDLQAVCEAADELLAELD